jgi:hypothetical protein
MVHGYPASLFTVHAWLMSRWVTVHAPSVMGDCLYGALSVPR